MNVRLRTKIKLEVELEYDGKLTKEEIALVRRMVHSRIIGSKGWGSLAISDHDISKFPEVELKEHGVSLR